MTRRKTHYCVPFGGYGNDVGRQFSTSRMEACHKVLSLGDLGEYELLASRTDCAPLKCAVTDVHLVCTTHRISGHPECMQSHLTRKRYSSPFAGSPLKSSGRLATGSICFPGTGTSKSESSSSALLRLFTIPSSAVDLGQEVQYGGRGKHLTFWSCATERLLLNKYSGRNNNALESR